ncbi:MAG: SDR family oxidoreductase [Sphingomicrobium sp.]
MSGSSGIAAVTGAGRGIGLACARRMARDGYRTIVIDRDGDVAEEAAAAIRADGQTVEAEPLDIRDRAAVRGLFDRLGAVDILVNNAAIASDMVGFLDLTPERLREMIEVNLLGTFVMCQEALAKMAWGGRIVNIASRGYLGGAGASHYVASKSGVVGLTRAMATELRWDGIRINCVAPGMTDTRMMSSFSDEMRAKLAKREPRGKAADPSEIASAVAFLCSADADFINGQVLLVDGGKLVGMPPL